MATRVINDTKGSGREGSLTGLGVGTLSERTQGMKEGRDTTEIWGRGHMLKNPKAYIQSV